MRGFRDERGAVLVQTGLAIIALLAMGTLSVDYGMLWVSRRQAQNSADAAALAGAISLAYSDPTDPNTTPRVKAVGVAAAQANTVWGEAPNVTADDVFIEPCPPGAPGDPDLCVRADVYRNQERGNPLPTWFGQMVGVAAHGVRATATAQVASGAKTTCLKPWIIPDKWQEVVPDPTAEWDMDSTFVRYDTSSGNPLNWTLLTPHDLYVGPTPTSPGTGFTVPDDIGTPIRLKVQNWDDSEVGPGNYRAVVLPGCGTGGNCVAENIAGCNPTPVGIGDVLETEPGNKIGPNIVNGVEVLVGSDSAYWVCANTGAPALPGVKCAGYPSTANTPRLVPVPAFDVQKYMDDAHAGLVKPNGRTDVTVTRVLGFFIESWSQSDKEIVGRFAYYPSSGISNGAVDDDANFLRKVILVR